MASTPGRSRHLASAARVAAALVLAGLAACAGPKKADAPAERVALVIGNSAYRAAPPLVNPRHDAEDMCAALRRLRFEVRCEMDVPDRAAMDRLLREHVERLGPRSVGVVFYAGHGVQAANANFLVPTGADPSAASRPTEVLYGVSELFDRLRRQPPRFQLVVLDACRADLFGPPAAAAGPATRSGLVRALEALPGAASGVRAVQDAPADTLVLYATAAGDTAFDGHGRNGPLTRHVLRHIAARELTVEEFLKKVTNDVAQDTAAGHARRQTPFVYGSFGGRFCFAGCAGDPVVMPAF